MEWQRVPPGRILTPDDKSLPAWAAGMTAADFVARGPHLSELWTPALVLDERALLGNAAFLAEWITGRGLELMPHGKTTMAPQLWRLQLDAGATGLTLATPWQVRVARSTGIREIMLANQLVDPHALDWLGADLAAHGGRVWTWIDDEAGLDALAAAPAAQPWDVLIELGRPGGRTGVRTVDAARALADRARATPGVRLAGVAGYEGAVAHGRSDDALAGAGAFVRDLVTLHELLLPDYDDPSDAIVTAGGSAFPDIVADILTDAAARLPGRFVIRSGASLIHDEGYYRSVSPFDGAGLRPAARAIARVVSAPEPGLVLLDAGKRDVAYDLDLPVPIGIAGEITGVNDQHAFLRTSEHIAVGDRVQLGLSHPCTMLDKWRLIPVVDDLTTHDPVIVGLVETRF
ncbi:MAG: alanine racemase [Microbacterium sp.]|uniref:alanine racemase n=1 Tax=Microbacterium sp. TaxID=51671 RepID=UPI001ACB35D7|nr:alanine racemase [Microbacterium sp.]MBN9176172.1 alanine racemase [Microbacterium sp.]